jgi:hypothetical protein
MITLRMTADVKDDRRVVVILPLSVPTGRAELVVTVDSRDVEREKNRDQALRQYLALARASSFHSDGPYPSRDELHERD